jgi:hypothetical protein
MARQLGRVGFHWRATFQHDNVPNWETWLREIQALGIGTLLICHDISCMRNYDPATGTLDPNRIPHDAQPGIEGMIRDLLAIGVEPAIRLSNLGGIRPSSIPAPVLDSLAKAGVKHVQIWNEPNDDREWQNHKVPTDWAVKSIQWALPACAYGLSIGLQMSLPPLNPGSEVNQFQIAVDLGAGDLFAKGLGINIHLYPFNRLIWKGKLYPYDDVNQHGEQLTETEYRALDPWYWNSYPREYINLLRRDMARPGITVMQDSDNFLGWQVHEHHMKTTLGATAAVPCRITEMGPRPWQDLDKRYPRLTPDEHARQVTLICRWLEGEISLGGVVRPNWLKAGYFWIMGASLLGDYSHVFEADAYYGDWNMDRRQPQYNHPQTPLGHMPAVDAIKQLARESPAGSTAPEVVTHLQRANSYLREARDQIAAL